MATKTIRTCDICGMTEASSRLGFTNVDYDGHGQREREDITYDTCFFCDHRIDRKARMIEKILKHDATTEQHNMIKYKLFLFACAIRTQAVTDAAEKPVDPPTADRIAYWG